MNKHRLLTLMAACLLATSISAEETEWSVVVTPNDGASINWLAVKTPDVSNAQELTMNSLKLHIGYVKSGSASAGYGATTSYMLISTSNESPSMVDGESVVAVSTNAPTPNNRYATYTFDGAKLKPSTTYYLYWVSSNVAASLYHATTQRLSLYKQYYAPGVFFDGNVNTAYSPSFSATLTYTPAEGGGEEGGEEDASVVKQVLFNNASSPIPYRIPAIAQAKNGDLIALSDYRTGFTDIGYGEVNVYAKVSRDNGDTWGPEFCIAGKNAVSGDDDTWYGDASIVADSQSDNVLVMLVSGNVAFPNSTRENPIHMAYARASYDAVTDKWTWEKPVDITSTVYGLLPTTKSLFFTSGKICQSKQIKVDEYYRIYCGLDTRPESGSNLNHNYVLYSDDFGATWHVLGSSTTPAITSGDECKCEELPNGDVVLSSRVLHGRIFNIFSYTDQQSGAGSWGTQENPSQSNNGIYRITDSSACNGEILLVDAIRNSDNQQVTLALQSIAFSRKILFVWYKELSTESDYNTPENFAKDWDGKYQVCNNTACYSTMIRQNCDCIGLYFEDGLKNNGYDMVYHLYPLETITSSKYSLVPTTTTLVGDVNQDRIVNVADVTTLIDYILCKQPSSRNTDACDVNQDGAVNVADVTSLIDLILTKE